MNLLLGTPGPASEVKHHVQSNQWSGEDINGIFVSALCHESFRLAPGGHTRPISVMVRLVPPFNAPLAVKLSYGSAASPRILRELELDPPEVSKLYTDFTTGKLSAQQYVERILPTF